MYHIRFKSCLSLRAEGWNDEKLFVFRVFYFCRILFSNNVQHKFKSLIHSEKHRRIRHFLIHEIVNYTSNLHYFAFLPIIYCSWPAFYNELNKYKFSCWNCVYYFIKYLNRIMKLNRTYNFAFVSCWNAEIFNKNKVGPVGSENETFISHNLKCFLRIIFDQVNMNAFLPLKWRANALYGILIK